MNRFAELLDRLAYEHGRNAKLRLMTEFFRTTPDPERGYALAALTGALSFPHAKSGLIRALIAERTDPVLFALSYDYVGDLSETVALMWPTPQRTAAHSAPDTLAPSPLEGEGWGGGFCRVAADKGSPPSRSRGEVSTKAIRERCKPQSYTKAVSRRRLPSPR
jgi:DNA ligase-1